MTEPIRPMPPADGRRSPIQDAATTEPDAAPSPWPSTGSSPYPTGPAAPHPYGGVADRPPGYVPAAYPPAPGAASNGSALALVILSGVCILPFFLLTQIPALIAGIQSLGATNTDPARAARLARLGWLLFAGGFAVIAAIAALGVAIVVLAVRPGG